MRSSRRSFLRLVAAAAATPALSRFPLAEGASPALRRVRAATGLLATWQSISWLGAEAGMFKNRGIDMTVPAIAVGGPEAAAGLSRGDWEFAHTGSLPVAEAVLQNRDVVIVATPTSDFPKAFIMTAKEITGLAQLGGRKVGLLTETGQTSVATRLSIEKAAGVGAVYVYLRTFDRVYAALAAGEIEAGALPIDLRFGGEARYGWNAFPIDSLDGPSIFATTRRLIASDRALVLSVLQGFIETIHLFKTRPDVIVPLLRRYVKIDDEVARALQAYHAPVFQKVPRPSLPGNGLEQLRSQLSSKYPAAAALKASDIADPSLIDELERSGFIDQVYVPANGSGR